MRPESEVDDLLCDSLKPNRRKCGPHGAGILIGELGVLVLILKCCKLLCRHLRSSSGIWYRSQLSEVCSESSDGSIGCHAGSRCGNRFNSLYFASPARKHWHGGQRNFTKHFAWVPNHVKRLSTSPLVPRGAHVWRRGDLSPAPKKRTLNPPRLQFRPSGLRPFMTSSWGWGKRIPPGLVSRRVGSTLYSRRLPARIGVRVGVHVSYENQRKHPCPRPPHSVPAPAP